MFMVDSDGSSVTRITDLPAIEDFPAWSPDGTRIAFDSDRDGNHKLFVISVDEAGR